MKVLLAHHAFPPGDAGGSEVYTETLARQLARRHEICVFHRSADPTRPDHDLCGSRREGFRIFSMNLRRGAGGFESYRDPRATGVAARLLDEVRPDLVHAGSLTGLSTGLVFEARRRGVPVVITLHDFGTLCPLGQLLDLGLRVCPGPSPTRCLGCVGEQALGSAPVRDWGRGLPLAAPLGRLLSRLSPQARNRIADRLDTMRELLRAADVLVAPSRFLRDRMAGLGVPEIEFIPQGVERRPSAPRRSELGRPLCFGFLGAAIPSKGVHVLAEAFRILDDSRACLRIHGAFVPYHGDTGYEARVRSILGPAAVESIVGPFRHDGIGEVLAGLDVVVVPSLWEENAPLVVEEAFLERRPLLVSDHGGLAERVREGVDGLRFRPGDPRDLARTMRRLLDEPGLRERLGSSPPDVSTMEEHVAALEVLYDRARRRSRERAGRVGVVVLDRGRPDDAAEAVRSARDRSLEPRIVVVENGPGPIPSAVPEAERLALPENRGYAAGMNAGIQHLRRAGCDRFLLLNNDAVLEPGSLRRLAEALGDTGLAAVGPVILRKRDGRVESRGGRFDLRWGRQRLAGSGEPPEPREGQRDVEVLSGAAWMLSLSGLDRVGPLDESYFHSFEEADWCVRARRAGLRLAVVLGARADHVGARTLGPESPERLYYAARNHLHAVERNLPLAGPARLLRRAVIVVLNLAHALAQGDVPRIAGVRAVLRGTSDFWRGRSGPSRERA